MIVLFLIVVVNTAWLCDDAYITFRMVDNFNNGYGLRWNVTERVQASSHPMWMFLISSVYSYTNEIYYTSIILSIAISLLSIILFLFKIAKSEVSAFLGMILLLFSKAFIDFSTSGLENPLTHLLIACFFFIYIKPEIDVKRFFLLAFISGLAVLNRMDIVLLFLPPLAFAFWKLKSIKTLFIAAAGFLPFITWEIFSLFYYGCLFPNTAYAKLNTGIPKLKLVEQGFFYIVNSLKIDPLTLVAIFTALVIAFMKRKKCHLAYAPGILLYLIYTVWIGGDFMSGRFFSALFFLSVLIICISIPEICRKKLSIKTLIFLTAVLALVIYRTSTLSSFPIFHQHGIADERIYWNKYLGLKNVFRTRGSCIFQHDWAKQGLEIYKKNTPIIEGAGGIGLLGFYAGPVAHILDAHALSDPLLSRMPAEKKWRIGHFSRKIPRDYMLSLLHGRNLIQHWGLSIYYDKLQLIIKGPLFDAARLKEIVNFNLGKYDHLLKTYLRDVEKNQEGKK